MRSERARVRGGLLLVITAMVLAGGAVGATSAAATAPRATASAPLASQTQGFFTAVSCATAWPPGGAWPSSSPTPPSFASAGWVCTLAPDEQPGRRDHGDASVGYEA